MDKLEQLKISENYDEDSIRDDELYEQYKQNAFLSSKDKYFDYYDDVKQPSKYIKEDW